MPFTVLERLLTTERYRPRMNRASSQQGSGYAVPALGEWGVKPGSGILLATNMRGALRVTRASQQNIARFGFTECSTEDEIRLLLELLVVMTTLAVPGEPSPRCTSIQEALLSLGQTGMEARTLVVPEGEVPTGMPDQLQVLTAELPAGTALVAVPPVHTGIYTRVGDHLGLLLRYSAFRVVVR